MQNDDKTVEALADRLQDEPYWGDQHLEGTTDHRQRLEHYAAIALQTQAQPEALVTDGLADEWTTMRLALHSIAGSSQDEYSRREALKALDGTRPVILTTLRQHDQGERDKALEEVFERIRAMSAEALLEGNETQADHYGDCLDVLRALKGATQ